MATLSHQQNQQVCHELSEQPPYGTPKSRSHALKLLLFGDVRGLTPEEIDEAMEVEGKYRRWAKTSQWSELGL